MTQPTMLSRGFNFLFSLPRPTMVLRKLSPISPERGPFHTLQRINRGNGTVYEGRRKILCCWCLPALFFPTMLRSFLSGSFLLDNESYSRSRYENVTPRTISNLFLGDTAEFRSKLRLCFLSHLLGKSFLFFSLFLII